MTKNLVEFANNHYTMPFKDLYNFSTATAVLRRMLCEEKTSISGVHTFRKLSSDGLYPNFTHDLPASKIAKLSDVSRPTPNQLLFKLRT